MKYHNLKSKFLSLLLVAVITISATGCSALNETADSTSASSTTESSTSTEVTTDTDSDNSTTDATEENSSIDVIDLTSIPAYDGSAVVEINGNVPYFSDEDKTRTDAFETYSDLDSLGRCGVAYANVCQEIMPTEDRGEIGSIKPTGWVQNKYPDIIPESPSYLYNRCHLIAFCLAGENANEKNLITGTRYLNISGMLPYEEKVADFVDSTNYHVLYRVTPIFDGDNLLASGVLMEGYSVEDNGAGICFCVYAYNVQPGIVIDYATGDNSADENYTANTETSDNTASNSSSSSVTSDNTVTSDTSATDSTETTYVINTNTGVFHYADCSSVNRMKEENKLYTNLSRDELISQGYKPCGNCNP